MSSLVVSYQSCISLLSLPTFASACWTFDGFSNAQTHCTYLTEIPEGVIGLVQLTFNSQCGHLYRGPEKETFKRALASPSTKFWLWGYMFKKGRWPSWMAGSDTHDGRQAWRTRSLSQDFLSKGFGLIAWVKCIFAYLFKNNAESETFNFLGSPRQWGCSFIGHFSLGLSSWNSHTIDIQESVRCLHRGAEEASWMHSIYPGLCFGTSGMNILRSYPKWLS